MTQLLATQLALAGVMGVPFMGGALAVVNQAFPELEVNKRREGLGERIAGGSVEEPSTLSDMAMMGIPSMMRMGLAEQAEHGKYAAGGERVQRVSAGKHAGTNV